MMEQKRKELQQRIEAEVADYFRRMQIAQNADTVIAANDLVNLQNKLATALGVQRIVTGSAKSMLVPEFVSKVIVYNDLGGVQLARR